MALVELANSPGSTFAKHELHCAVLPVMDTIYVPVPLYLILKHVRCRNCDPVHSPCLPVYYRTEFLFFSTNLVLIFRGYRLDYTFYRFPPASTYFLPRYPSKLFASFTHAPLAHELIPIARADVRSYLCLWLASRDHGV